MKLGRSEDMNFSTILHPTKSRKSISIYSVSLLTTLLLSTILSAPSVVAATNSSATPPTQSSAAYVPAAPTFFGHAGALNPLFFSGPFVAPPAFGPPPPNPFGSVSTASTTEDSHGNIRFAPDHGWKPDSSGSAGSTITPSTSCASSSSGCQSVSSTSGGVTTNKFALNAVPNRLTFGFNVEPPDQGLCANSQYVVEGMNLGIAQVYNASTLQP